MTDWVKVLDANVDAVYPDKINDPQREIHLSKMIYDYVCEQLKVDELKEYRGCKIIVH